MADTLELDCPGCGQTLEVDAGFIGGVCRCSHCGAVIAVDGSGSAPRASRRPGSPRDGGATSGSDFDRISVVSARPGGPDAGASASASVSRGSISRSRVEPTKASPLPLMLGIAGAAVLLIGVVVVVVLLSGGSGGDAASQQADAGDQQPAPSAVPVQADNPWDRPAEERAEQEPEDDVLAPVPEGLKLRAAWEFDGNARDTSGFGAACDGILTQGAAVRDGRLVLDGVDDHMQIRVDPKINNIGKRMRIDIRFRAAEPGRPGVKQVLFESGGGERGFNVYLYNNRLYCGGYSRPGHPESGWAGHWLRSDAVRANRWHTLTLELNAGEKPAPNALSATLDGEPIGSTTGARIWNNTGRNMIGGVQQNARFHNGVTHDLNPFKGEIDFIRIYGR